MSRRKTKVLASRIEYLSPTDCDSTVGYKITSRKYFNAQMSLTDCNRKIEWFFDSDADGLKKIDNVVDIVTSFRAAYLAARAKFKRRRRR